MAKCTLNAEALVRFSKKINADLKKEIAKETPIAFNLKDYMNKIYDLVAKRNGDTNLAAAHAKAIPAIINKYQAIDSTIRKYVIKEAADILGQSDLHADEANDVLLDFLGKKVVETPVVPEQQKQNASIALNNTYIQTPVAPTRKVFIPKNWFQALPESFKSSTTSEAISIIPGDPNYNVPHKGEIEKLKNAVQRKVVNLFYSGKVNNNYGVEYEGVDGGLYLTVMSDVNKKLDYDKLPETRKEYWDPKGGENAFKQNTFGVELVLTDSDGEIVYFNKNMEVSSKEEGYPVVLSLRGAKLTTGVDKGVMSIEDFAKNIQRREKLTGEEGYQQALKKAEAIRAQEEALVKRMRDFLKNNPQETITFPIAGGSTGYIETNMERLISVSSIKNIDDFTLSITDKGFPTLVMTSTGDAIDVYINKQSKDFAKTLAEYLIYPVVDATTNKSVSLEEKRQILSTYYNPNLVYIDSVTNTVNVKVGSQYVKASLTEPSQEGVEAIASALSQYYLTDITQDPKTGKYVEISKEIFDSKKESQKIKTFDPNSNQTLVGKFIQKDGKYYQVKQIYAAHKRENLKTNQFKSIASVDITGTKPKVTYSETVPYSDYVKSTLITSAQLNGEGNVVKIHPYIGWEIYSGTKADQQVNGNHGVVQTTITSDTYDDAYEVNESPADQGIDTDSKDAPETFFEALQKNKSFFEKSTKTKITEKKAAKEFLDNAESWYNSTDLAKHIPFKVMFNAINTSTPNAVATWDINGITLLKGSDMSDLYHESWHGFTQLFLTKEQKDKLYAEVRKQSGSFTDYKGTRVEFKNASRLQIEEHLAEGFREYVISGGKKVLDATPVRKSIFQKILAFLKSLFGKVSYTQALSEIRSTKEIADMYEKLYVGDLNEYKFDPRNVEFDVLTKNMEAVNEEERNEHSISRTETLLINQSVDSIISDITYRLALSNNAAISYNILAKKEARSLLYKEVKRTLEERLQERKKELSEITKDLSGYENYSGDAEGADKYWAERGYEYGLGKQIDFTPDSYDQSSEELKEETEQAYKTAVARLGRKELAADFPAGKLVRRDYMQVKYSDAVFAVSEIILPGEKGKAVKGKRYENTTKKAIVDGGTGYAVQMAIDLGKPVYVFHQGTLADNTTKVGWYEWNDTEFEPMDAPALTQRYAGVGSRQLNDAGKKAIEDVYKTTIDLIEADPNSTSPKKQRIQNDIRILQYAVDNFGDTDNLSNNPLGVGVIGYHKFRSEVLSFDDRFEDEIEEKKNEEGRLGSKEGNEESIDEFMPVEIKTLLKGLKSKQKNRLGFDVPLNERLVINRFVRTIVGNDGVIDIHNRLIKASEEFTPFKELLVKLGDPMSPVGGIQRLWDAVNYVGRISEAKLKQLTINETTGYTNEQGEFVKSKESEFEINFGEGYGDFKAVQLSWENSFKSAKSRYITVQDDIRFLNLKNIFADFPTVTVALNNKRAFLSALGINLSEAKEIDEILNEIRPDSYSIGRVDRLYNIAQAYNDNNLLVTSINDLIKDNTDLNSDFTNEITNYNDLANLELKYSDRFSNFSKTTAEGTNQYTITKNNSMFEITNSINNSEDFPTMVAKPQTSHFATNRNPYSRASVQMNSVFNMNTGKKRVDIKGNPVKISIDNLSGVSLLRDSAEFINGIALAKVDKPTKLVTDLHSFLTAGVVENMRHADKTSSFGSRPTKMHGTGSNGMLYIDTYRFIKSELGTEDFANIMMRYLIAEHDRINIFNNLPESDPAKNVPLFKDTAKEFALFHGILTNDVKNKLYAIKTDPYNGVSLLEYLGYTYNDGRLVVKSSTDEQIALREEIKDNIKEYLELKAASLEKFYTSINIFDKQLLKTIKKDAIRNQIAPATIDPQSLKSSAITSYFANKLIHSVENSILFYGDTAAYDHTKLEQSKRIALFGSTGPIPRSDEGFVNYVNSDQFGGRAYGKTKGVDYKYTNILRTGVISDDVITSPYKDKFIERTEKEIAERFKYRKDKTWLNATEEEKQEIVRAQAEIQYDAYKGMKTNDSQGLISFDAYRILAKSLKDWSQEQEDMYQDIVKGKPVDRKKSEQVFPVMKLQHAGPLMTESLPLMAGHKYSLFPLIPTVIKGTKLEQVHDMMIQQNMDYLVPISGSKISSITKDGKPDELYKDGKLNTDLVFTNNPIYTGFLKKQVNVEPYLKGKVRFATQLRKIGTLGLYDGGVPSDFMPGVEDSSEKRLAWKSLSESEKNKYSNYKLSKEYEESLNRLMSFIEKDLLNEIDWKIVNGVPQGSMKNLLDLIEREFVRRERPQSDLDFLQIDKNGKLIRDLSILTDSGQIQRMLIALAEKKLIRQKVKGEGLIQGAHSMFESKTAVRFKKPTEEQLKEHGASHLPFYDFTVNPDGTYSNTSAAKVKIALQGDFKKLLSAKHNDGKPIKDLARLNAMIKNEKWLNTRNNRKMITMISARIPVGERNFVEFFEVYEFLPEEAGPIMIVPAELVAKNGGDFDFDKQMTLLPNINKIGDSIDYLQSEVSEAQARKYYDEIKKVNEKFDVPFEKFYISLNTSAANNSVIQNLKSIFERPENFTYLTNSSSNYIFDPIVDQYKKEGMERGEIIDYQIDAKGVKTKWYNTKGELKASISPTTAFEPEFDLETHSNNNVGKDVVGITASSNGYAPVANRVGLYMNPFRGIGTYEDYLEAANADPRRRSDYQKLVYKTFRLQRLLLDHRSLTTDAKGNLVIGKAITQAPVSAQLTINKNVQDIIYKSNLEKGEYEVALVNGVQTFISLQKMPETIKKGYTVFYSDYLKGQGLIKRAGKKIVVPGFEDINLMLDQKDKSIIELSTGLEINTKSSKQTEIIKELEEIFRTKNVREVIEKSKKINANQPNVTISKLEQSTASSLPTQAPVNATQPSTSVEAKGVYSAISLSNLNDIDNKNPNSEVGSQQLNGGLDVARNPWLFYINANKEAAPVLSFLKQAGVPVEVAVSLINQPIVKEYIKLLKEVKSPTAPIKGVTLVNPNFYRLKAREIILSDPKYGFNQSLDVVAGPGSPARVYELALKYTQGLTPKDFSLDNLKKHESMGMNNEMARAIFAHYMEVEDNSKYYSKLVRNTSMDTQTESTLFAAINRDLMFADLYSDNAFPKEVLDKIATESQISSFFNRKTIVALYKDLFEFRDNPKIIRFLTEKIKTQEFKDLVEAAYNDDVDAAAGAFQDAITNYVFQQALTNVNLVDGYYKGLTSRDSFKTKQIGEIASFPAQVLEENGVPVLYYNLDIIEKQYQKVSSKMFPTLKSYQMYVFEKAYQKYKNNIEDYKETQDFKQRKAKLKETIKRRANKIEKSKASDKKLLPVDDIRNFKTLSRGKELETYFPTTYIRKSGYPQSVTFILNDNGLYDLTDVSTGEIFNSNVDLTDGFEYNVTVTEALAESKSDYNERVNKAAYEAYLTNEALANTFNIYQLFESSENFAQEFYNFKYKYKKLSEKYLIFNILEKSDSKTSGIKNLTIKGIQLDGKTLDIVHDEIKQLANYNSMLIEAREVGITDPGEIKKLSEMFKRFTYYTFLQSGIGGKGNFGIQKLGLQDLYSRLLTSPVNPNNPGSKSILQNFQEIMNTDLLNKIFETFAQNAVTDKRFRLNDYTIKSYKKPGLDVKFKEYVPGVYRYEGVNFENFAEAEEYFLSAIENYERSGKSASDLVFVINTAVKSKKAKQDQLTAILKGTGATVIGIPVRDAFAEKTHFKDETFDDNMAQISPVIDQLAERKNQGKTLIVSDLGYGQNMIGLSDITGKPVVGTGGAENTFVHLSRELYKKLGYINSNFQERPEFELEETDNETVKEFMKLCLIPGSL